MRQELFNGGKNSRLAPHLIGANEGVEYLNIDNESGILVPVKKKLDISINLLEHSFYFNAQNVWVTSSVNRDYVEYRNTLYFTEDSTNPKKTTDGLTFYNLGISIPTNTPISAIGAVGVLTGTYQYLITFYNSIDGTESAGSPLSTELIAASDSIDLSGLEISTDPQVDKKRLYRIGGDLTAFTLVTTLANSTATYNDNIADIDVDGRIYESASYTPALSGLKFLTEHYGIFMAALADKVYFTPIGKPDAWPATNYIDFDTDVTGIGKVLNGILVFTAFKTYIITGTNVRSFVKNTLTVTQGCREHKTIQHLSEGELVWVSDDGLCSTSGGRVKVISKSKLGKLNLTAVNAVVHNEVYYLQKADGTVLALDTRYGPIFKDLDSGTTRLIVANDVFYGFVNNTLYKMFADTSSETYTYLSPNFVERSYTGLKQYKHFYMRSNGDVVLTILMDGIVVLTKPLTGLATHDIQVPQAKQSSYSLQFKLVGTAEVYEVEYKSLPRRTN